MNARAQLREKLWRVVGSVGFIVVVAFLVRTGFLYYYFRFIVQRMVRDYLPFGYEAGSIAAAIAQGRGFSSPLRMVQTGPTAWFTPVYPYLLAAVFKTLGVYSYSSNIVIRCINNAFSAFTCWPIYAIGAKVFGRKYGLAAAWIWVVFPMSLFFSTVWVWDTALSTLMLTIIIAATLEMRGSESLRSWLGYGALWAAGAMVNASVLSVLPPLALWAIWPLRRQLMPAGKLLAASSLIFIVGITPWTIRNYAVFHKFIPFRSNFALELWLGNNPAVPDSWSPWLHPNDDPSEAAKYARMTEIPYMEEKQHESVLFMRTHPVETMGFIFRRFSDNWIAMWDSPADIWSRVDLTTKLGIVGNCLFPLLSLLGVLLAYRQRNEIAVPFGAVMLFFPLIFYITHTSSRYRHPMDPLMLVLAVYALAYPVIYWRKRLSGLETAHPSESYERLMARR
jgi:4-amino-4-deoxy-L-arabinose transferase-like glycosyltransferase